MGFAAGRAAAGRSFAGLIVPDPAATSSHVALPDPATGLSLSCRRLDPASGDYVFTADGRPEGWTTAQQQMFLALRTVRGSAAVAALGQDASTIQVKGSDYPRQLSTRINAAVASIVAQGLVEILSIQTADRSADGGVAVVRWRDLSTGLEQTNTLR